ncbi:MAG: type II secretion system protein GspN [Syntrophales bacterium]|nr:type II secretion system protein GspN [Syntrophales bacterium]
MKRGKIILVAFLGLIVLYFALFLRFPPDLCRLALSSSVSNVKYPFQIGIGDCRPAFPLGIKMDRLTIRAPLGREELVIKNITLKPSLSMLWGKWNVTGLANLMDGTLEFSGCIGRNDLEEIRLKSINLDNRFLKSLLGRDIKGRMDGQMVKKEKGARQATFRIVRGYYQLSLPGWSGIEISELEGKIMYQDGTLVIEKVDVTNPVMRGKLRGNINVHWPDLEQSRIDLTWEMEGRDIGKTQSSLQGTIKNITLMPASATIK